MTAEIWVKFTRPGFHYWPSAEEVRPERKYLGSVHRHLFHVTIMVPVSHDDRDIEFHDLRDYAESVWPKDGQMGSDSCEAIARKYCDRVMSQWPQLNYVTVQVSEDGECGATVTVGNRHVL